MEEASKPQRDVVFLFGAGASYGAGGILPERPPLGSELYKELSRLHPGSWGALPSEITKEFDSNFEAGMALVHQHFGMAIPQLMREMAIYFIQFRAATQDCLYSRLVRDLETNNLLQKVCFSTLNYDCVLDFSILASGRDIRYFDNTEGDAIPLWKLHGSCNMFSHGVHAAQSVSYSTGVTFNAGIIAYSDSNQVINHCLNETGLAPVMCLYMKGKPLHVSPGAVHSIQEIWRNQVLAARTVAIIGVRPWPEDVHIWEPLKNTTATLLFVGKETEIADWVKDRQKGKSIFIGERFNESYRRLIMEVTSSCN